MPEGDTIYKLAARLRPALVERPLARVWLRERGDVAALAGGRVREIATLGKHLLLVVAPPGATRAAEDRVLHVHLGMRGRWRRADPQARVTPAADLAVATDADLFSCTRAGTVRLLRRIEVRDDPMLSRLGPDLMAEHFPLEAVVKRARAREARSAAELLLDQSVACGLGNAFKSDVLFAERVHPETSPGDLSDAELARLFSRAREMLRWNREGGRRVTTRPVTPDRPLARGEPTHPVYDRAREPCPRCGAPIRSARVGDAARVTFWCERCQPVHGRAWGWVGR